MNSITSKELINYPTAVLVSGGLDSAILLADMVNHRFPKVWPIFIQCGLYW
jgi:tRNA(Ile)-lysidine synthase TilS/MesJ